MKQGIQEFHRKYVLVPADKAANNVVVVCRLHYVNTLKQELDGTRAYLETDTDEVSVVNAHLNDLPVKFSVCVNEGQDKLPTLYWLPKLHKRPYKARFIANSSSCTTTELSKLLTSCLTAIKSHVIRYCETVYEKVQVGKDQAKAQSEKDSHSKNQGRKKPNQQSGTHTMKTFRKPNEQLFSQ